MSAYRRMDGSDAAGRGLREAIRLAKEEGAQLFIIHVVNEYYAFANLDGAAPVDIVPMREGGRPQRGFVGQGHPERQGAGKPPC